MHAWELIVQGTPPTVLCNDHAKFETNDQVHVDVANDSPRSQAPPSFSSLAVDFSFVRRESLHGNEASK